MASIKNETQAAQWLTQCVADMVVKLKVSHNEATILLLKEAVRELNQAKCEVKK